eukprot:2927349-Prymnesium_polylepis.1
MLGHPLPPGIHEGIRENHVWVYTHQQQLHSAHSADSSFTHSLTPLATPTPYHPQGSTTAMATSQGGVSATELADLRYAAKPIDWYLRIKFEVASPNLQSHLGNLPSDLGAADGRPTGARQTQLW